MVDYEDFDREQLEDAVLERFESLYSNTWNWEANGGREDVQDRIEDIPTETLQEMLDYSDEQWGDLAEYGYGEGQEEPPDWLIEMGWYDDDGDWINPFWYH